MNTSMLVFQVACRAKKKRFGLSLDLLRDIDPDKSSWSMASVGRATFTLRKKEPGPWARLLRSRQKLPHMHRWWAMAEQHDSALRKWKPENATGNATAIDEHGDKNSSASSSSPNSTTVEPAASGGDSAGHAPGSSPAEQSSESPPPASEDKGVDEEGQSRLDRMLEQIDEDEAAQLKEAAKAARMQKQEVDRQARKDKARIDKEAKRAREQVRRDAAKKRASARKEAEAEAGAVSEGG